MHAYHDVMLIVLITVMYSSFVLVMFIKSFKLGQSVTTAQKMVWLINY
jgi:hypothetical protein